MSSIPMQDLEKMPMGMPVTVGELADFLGHACEQRPAEGAAKNGSDSGPERWADRVGDEAADKDEAAALPPAPSADMLDWSLAQWRSHCLKRRGEDAAKAECTASTSRLTVEERPRGGPVLVHQVPLAPPRPILCTDDPEASLLKAVELLLAYPELDALPIVSPVRCTVVAHLTLSYCLAYMLPRMRGSDVLPLGTLPVSAAVDGAPTFRKFDAKASKAESWADTRSSQALQAPVVLTQSQTLRELLAFFTQTHHSGVPVVEENGCGGVLGLLSRRDMLSYLDLAMQSARRCAEGQGVVPEADRVELDMGTSAEVVLTTLRRFRHLPADEAGSGAGAMLVHDKELTLKAAILRLLAADNRKLLFVRDGGSGQAPRLLRVVSVSDLWRLLLGDAEDFQDVTKPSGNEEQLVAQDV